MALWIKGALFSVLTSTRGLRLLGMLKAQLFLVESTDSRSLAWSWCLMIQCELYRHLLKVRPTRVPLSTEIELVFWSRNAIDCLFRRLLCFPESPLLTSPPCPSTLPLILIYLVLLLSSSATLSL